MFSTIEQPGIGSYLVPASPLELTAAGRLPAAAARPRWASTRRRSWRTCSGSARPRSGGCSTRGGRGPDQACRPHSVLPVPAQRPSRPAPGTVQCVQPIVG